MTHLKFFLLKIRRKTYPIIDICMQKNITQSIAIAAQKIGNFISIDVCFQESMEFNKNTFKKSLHAAFLLVFRYAPYFHNSKAVFVELISSLNQYLKLYVVRTFTS
jgi:hypothetical protein